MSGLIEVGQQELKYEEAACVLRGAIDYRGKHAGEERLHFLSLDLNARMCEGLAAFDGRLNPAEELNSFALKKWILVEVGAWLFARKVCELRLQLDPRMDRG